jgi:hypothetical protein
MNNYSFLNNKRKYPFEQSKIEYDNFQLNSNENKNSKKKLIPYDIFSNSTKNESFDSNKGKLIPTFIYKSPIFNSSENNNIFNYVENENEKNKNILLKEEKNNNINSYLVNNIRNKNDIKNPKLVEFNYIKLYSFPTENKKAKIKIIKNNYIPHIRKKISFKLTKIKKPKIFRIEKIYNKKEYEEANKIFTENNHNEYHINLKRIKQIFINNCLKIYSYFNLENKKNENELNMIHKIIPLLKINKINSSHLSNLLNYNEDEDDKYRKHYFMFSAEAKKFCLDLLQNEKVPFEVIIKMARVPRKSLRRWSLVGIYRKKGCGRKIRDPIMEQNLINWYKESINKKIFPTAKLIREKAIELSGDKNFLASKGWLEKLKKKYDIKIFTRSDIKIKKINNKNDNNNVNNNIKVYNKKIFNNEIVIKKEKIFSKEIVKKDKKKFIFKKITYNDENIKNNKEDN